GSHSWVPWVGQRLLISANGPGDVRMVQHLTDPSGARRRRLVCVAFEKHMGTGQFSGRVRMLVLPGDDPSVPVEVSAGDPTDLPPRSLHLACDHLFLNEPGWLTQASGDVVVRGQRFEARAGSFQYD